MGFFTLEEEAPTINTSIVLNRPYGGGIIFSCRQLQLGQAMRFRQKADLTQHLRGISLSPLRRTDAVTAVPEILQKIVELIAQVNDPDDSVIACPDGKKSIGQYSAWINGVHMGIGLSSAFLSAITV